MSKSFRIFKNFRKSHGERGKLTFSDYKKALHLMQKIEKRTRKKYLKVKSILSQGRQSVVVGNAIYYWGEDKKTIAALTPDFDMTRMVFEMIKNGEV